MMQAGGADLFDHRNSHQHNTATAINTAVSNHQEVI